MSINELTLKIEELEKRNQMQIYKYEKQQDFVLFLMQKCEALEKTIKDQAQVISQLQGNYVLLPVFQSDSTSTLGASFDSGTGSNIDANASLLAARTTTSTPQQQLQVIETSEDDITDQLSVVNSSAGNHAEKDEKPAAAHESAKPKTSDPAVIVVEEEGNEKEDNEKALAASSFAVKVKIGDNIDISMGAINRSTGEIVLKKKTFNLVIGNSFLSEQLVGANIGSEKFFFKKRAVKILKELKVGLPEDISDIALKISIPAI